MVEVTENLAINIVMRRQHQVARLPRIGAPEGVVDSKVLAHGGGIRWEKNSTEYLTILEWIKGAVE